MFFALFFYNFRFDALKNNAISFTFYLVLQELLARIFDPETGNKKI